VEGEPVCKKLEQGFAASAFVGYSSAHARQFLQKIYMHFDVVGDVALVQPQLRHQIFFFFKVILGILRQLIKNLFNLDERNVYRL